MFGSTWLQLYENERIYNILELRKRRDELQRYESLRLNDKNKQTLDLDSRFVTYIKLRKFVLHLFPNLNRSQITIERSDME